MENNKKSLRLTDEQKLKLALSSKQAASQKAKGGNFFVNIFSVEGRAPRSEWWLTVIFGSMLVGFVIGISCMILGVGEIFIGLGALAITIPVSIRRLHDLNKSGLFVLLMVGINICGTGLMNAALQKEAKMQMKSYSFYEYESAREEYESIESLALVGLLIWGVNQLVWTIILGFISGTTGKNMYGEDSCGSGGVLDELEAKHKLQTMVHATVNKELGRTMRLNALSGRPVQQSKTPPPAAPAPAPAEAPAQTPKDRLEKLKSLRDEGFLTDEEYEAKRKEIIASI